LARIYDDVQRVPDRVRAQEPEIRRGKMTRVPTIRPNGYEKSSEVLKVYCTPTEALLWRSVFGRELSERVRRYLHRAARKEAKLP